MHLIKVNLKDFSAAHRLNKEYKGKCENLHGHNYAINITLAAAELDKNDFVVDFGDVKKIFNDWVQSQLDHVVIVSELDKPLLDFSINNKQKYYLMPNGMNSTAECLAKHLFEQFNLLLTKITANNVKLLAVEIWETANSSAIYTRSG